MMNTDAQTMHEMIRAAGMKLRTLREKAEITQQGMEKATADRYGWDNRVYAQQVSRIEKGQLDKPPILDLLRIGGILGLSPDDIAEMYGLWPRQSGSTSLDPRLQAAIALTEELPFAEREKLLEWIQFATLQARAEMRAAQRAESHEENPKATAAGTGAGTGRAPRPIRTTPARR